MEVQPAAHYSVGGVRTDLWGRSSVPGLLVAGEAASVGLHGANRLASNSLSEGLVFGARAAQAAAELAPARASGKPEATPALSLPAGVSWAAVQPVFAAAAGLERCGPELQAALDIWPEVYLHTSDKATTPDAANVLLAAAVLQAALARQETRGTHARSDFEQAAPQACHADLRLCPAPPGGPAVWEQRTVPVSSTDLDLQPQPNSFFALNK
ncbi:FAD-binding protein [Deinococcus radiophilus]|uniref:FAD-binding protein n=1 Tax=Deinococcus radiophilus TaxID=32062 RepID=UPI003608D85B